MTASDSAIVPTPWRNPEFRSYTAATAFTAFAFGMQQLLTNVLMIDRLQASAATVGVAQALIGLPGLLLMLWGGANADRVDGRALLVRLYALMALPSLCLAALASNSTLSLLSVTLWGLVIAACNSIASPALQAMLNRICGPHVQRGVTIGTIVGFLVQIAALLLAGRIDELGAERVLLLQSAMAAAGAIAISRLRSAPPATVPQRSSTLAEIRAGLQSIRADALLLHVMLLNFLSMLFNAGAFNIVFPFLILEAYGAEPHALGVLMAVFFGGATASNFLLLHFMPIDRIGRVFLLMQLTRVVVLVGLWLQPSALWLGLFTFLWGVNMGITSTTSRAIVQERAAPAFRGRVMSVLNLGFLGAAPFAALLLGGVIEWSSPTTALLPGIVASFVIFGFGVWRTPIWHYRSSVVPV